MLSTDRPSASPCRSPTPTPTGTSAAYRAYRERYGVPAHTPMIGPRPAALRPDARAAWEHACLQANRYLARRLDDLDDQALAELDTRQQAILDNPPPFDPAELERARQHLDAGGQTGRSTNAEELYVQRLERAAQANRDWRRSAADALAIRRQITLELERRRRELKSRSAIRLAR
jgi:hypothetical protein